jgi:hypothetical protein
MTRRLLRYAARLAVVAGGWACTRGEGAQRERVEAADTPIRTAVAARPLFDTVRRTEPGALGAVAAAGVQRRTGPGGERFDVSARTEVIGTGGHFRRFGTKTLDIALRTRSPRLDQYPCTSCHLGRATTIAAERAADAHRDIEARHPAETGAGCATCHAAENVELLALESGERVTVDHAYRLCAQCHAEQVQAWAGGAHGKRLDGWRGRRVVMACADCHDPHEPAPEARTPFRPPRLHRPGSGEP